MSRPTAEPTSPDDGLPLTTEASGSAEITPATFRESFGEDLDHALDLSTWLPGSLSREYERIEREVREAVQAEDTLQARIRTEIFPLLEGPESRVPGGGVYQARSEDLAELHQKLLFSGGVEACDGTVEVHDTLPLTIYQIGVSLVSYRGDQGTWQQRLFRRDLRQHTGDPVGEMASVLRRRSRRGALNRATAQDALGDMAQRALMSYAERGILLEHSRAAWRLGHGNPAPYELLTGGGCLELMVAATNAVRRLIQVHERFVFVASEPRERLLLTLGHALRPLEYALVGTLDERLRGWLHQERFSLGRGEELCWDDEPIPATRWIPRFIDEVASQVVIGLYRATRMAPAQLFYAHVDHAHEAAHLVLADSVLREHRGFPLLIDLADHVCRALFGNTLQELTQSAYASAGVPWRYASERATRGS